MRFYKLDCDDRYLLAEYSKKMRGRWRKVIYVCPEGHYIREDKLYLDLAIILPTSQIGDFVWTWYHDCLVTERVAQLLRESELTGYQLVEVEVEKVKKYHVIKDIVLIDGKGYGYTKGVRDKNPKPVPRLYQLVVTGMGGHVDERTGLKLEEECPFCGRHKYSGFYRGIYIDERQWDGSDFFRVYPLVGLIIASERVKLFVEEHKLTNCVFIPVEEVEGDESGMALGGKADREKYRVIRH